MLRSCLAWCLAALGQCFRVSWLKDGAHAYLKTKTMKTSNLAMEVTGNWKL